VTPQKILVTGGAGFIGGHLIERLLARGDQILAVDNFEPVGRPEERRALAKRLDAHPACRVAEADIRQRETIRSLVQGFRPDAIAHLAAHAGVRRSVEDPWAYTATNIDGTLAMLDAARAGGVRRFVFASSSSVYGADPVVPFREDVALRHVISPYAATKVAGEALCSSYAAVHGLSTVSLRFFTVYGPRQRPDLAIRDFGERILAGRPVVLFGDGSSSRDYTYVDDIVSGIVGALDLPEAHHEVFNLGNSSPVPLLDLVRALEAAIGIPAQVQWRPFPPGDVPRTFADIDKARRVLGYHPATPLAAGLAAMVAWLRSRERALPADANDERR
jgi:UDP-glucuronate 4-epimerase